ncbi:hypothetical protein C2845_PM08G15090 [Panicum miliaceum]|uniref:Uncharacterized protein n=1 Tax=Panicum miliaceum TaxID=4540 RepID=A0A3L6QVY0_PANMI|nr:hypothetical protein C2845_PM08G15090 [Panicum miliaceum]
MRALPAWLAPLLETKFSEAYPEHPGVIRLMRNFGCNFFYTSCTGCALYFGCLPDHAGHQLIQIRKLSSHYVVKVAEIEHLLSLSLVQTYLINSEPAMFLDKPKITGQGKLGASRCEECNWGLQDAGCLFCSIR